MMNVHICAISPIYGYRNQKIRQLLSNLPYGASGENRTLVPSLENLYTNRCTTLANPTIYFIPIAFTCQKAKTKNQRPT